MTEREDLSKMQTLGASNPHNNKDKHRCNIRYYFNNYLELLLSMTKSAYFRVAH